jgi:UDPglucose--hexose-1-phosphate uridylyltransferase
MNSPASTAPDFRRDPVTGRWVIVAPERSLRPMGLEGAEPRHRAGGETRPCPFCPGNERDTPHEVFAIRDPGTPPDGPGWRLRVVPNMYPAVRYSDAQAGLPVPPDRLFASFPGIGRHEVVIESPDHVADPAILSDDLFRDVFIAYRQRLIAHATDPNLHYASVFKNVGAEAGASLGHCHSQIIAVPIIPDLVQQELNGSLNYHSKHGRCVFCDIVQSEMADRSRFVAETPHLAAIAAYAGRFSHEVWILPKEHASRYEAIADSLAAELAGLMKKLVRALDLVLGEPAYNWFLHGAPLRSLELSHYHWHFELMPRSSRPAGFEWGTGCYISAVSPETAAEQLRAALG